MTVCLSACSHLYYTSRYFNRLYIYASIGKQFPISQFLQTSSSLKLLNRFAWNLKWHFLRVSRTKWPFGYLIGSKKWPPFLIIEHRGQTADFPNFYPWLTWFDATFRCIAYSNFSSVLVCVEPEGEIKHVSWDVVILLYRRLSSLLKNVQNSSSDTTPPIETKHGVNVPWGVLHKTHVQIFDPSKKHGHCY